MASITLAWEAIPDANLAGYRVYWGSASGVYTNDPVPFIEPTAQPSYKTPSLADGTWYFAVVAVDSNGNAGTISGQAWATLSGGVIVASGADGGITPPAAPTNLRFVR